MLQLEKVPFLVSQSLFHAGAESGCEGGKRGHWSDASPLGLIVIVDEL